MKKALSLMVIVVLLVLCSTLFFACSTPSLCVVCFDSCGGEAVEAVQVPRGNKLETPAAPLRAGYEFRGWYADSLCTVLWDFSSDVVGGNVTLYAGWSLLCPVYVTLSDGNGKTVLAMQSVSAVDTDNDGKVTLNEALATAHREFCPAGADGYSSLPTQYGLSITTLWGDSCGSYGYYVNNLSSSSAADEVKNGDSIYAYVYTDLSAYSDSYSYFDRSMVSAEVDEAVTLNLYVCGYDSAWMPTVSPAAQAVISINGNASAYSTDSQGCVTLSFTQSGVYNISATLEGKTLVPPVCIVTVK